MPIKKQFKELPSVTRILSKTKPYYQIQALKRWEENMIKKMGPDGFAQYKRKMFREGSEVHKLIEYRFTDKSKYETTLGLADSSVINFHESIEIYMKNSKYKILEVIDVEYPSRHPDREFWGIVDCIAYIDNLGWAVVDWKTSRKKKNVSFREIHYH